MFLNLSDLSSEPLQSQIVRQVRALVLSGDLPPGSELPSIRGLAREQHVSFVTVQKAYENLVSAGLILSRRGKGFFVSQIEEDRKKEIAEQRFREKITHTFDLAIAEGLSKEDILICVKTILENK